MVNIRGQDHHLIAAFVLHFEGAWAQPLDYPALYRLSQALRYAMRLASALGKRVWKSMMLTHSGRTAMRPACERS